MRWFLGQIPDDSGENRQGKTYQQGHSHGVKIDKKLKDSRKEIVRVEVAPQL